MSHPEEPDAEPAQQEAADAGAELVRLEAVAPGDEFVRRETVEAALGRLANVFVTSEEVNDSWEKAKAALRGVKVDCLSDVVSGLSAAGTPFVLRPLGMRGFDDAKVRVTLSEFLRHALFAAARIRTGLKEAAGSTRDLAVESSTSPGGDRAAQDPIFLEMIETAEESEKGAIFTEHPERLVAPEVFQDELPAHGDGDLAGAAVSTLLSRARQEFNALAEWHGVRVPPKVAEEFREALDAAEECLRQIRSPKIPATFIASDVHDGIVAAFQVAGADLEKVPGSGNAADILTRIVLELAGLVTGLDRDDAKRAEYTRRMRNRADEQAYHGRSPVVVAPFPVEHT